MYSYTWCWTQTGRHVTAVCVWPVSEARSGIRLWSGWLVTQWCQLSYLTLNVIGSLTTDGNTGSDKVREGRGHSAPLEGQLDRPEDRTNSWHISSNPTTAHYTHAALYRGGTREYRSPLQSEWHGEVDILLDIEKKKCTTTDTTRRWEQLNRSYVHKLQHCKGILHQNVKCLQSREPSRRAEREENINKHSCLIY